jgi:hypothetical protein
MNGQFQNPFESIESAHDFFRLLSEEVLEAKQEIDADLQRESALPSSRRLDALRVASYGLEKLEAHVIRSSRILNDLRSLRRLLFSERVSTRHVRAIGAQLEEVKVDDHPAWVQRPLDRAGVRTGRPTATEAGSTKRAATAA